MTTNRPPHTAENKAPAAAESVVAAEHEVPQQLTLVPTNYTGPWRLSVATRRRGLQGVSAARAALEAARQRAAAEDEARRLARHAHAPRRCA
jgi:hypothetical protein